MKGFLRALVPELRASPELPTTDLLNPDTWISEYLSGERPTYTGKPVSISGAMRLAAVYSCCNARAEDLAKIPLDLFRRKPDDGGREKVAAGSLANLLRRPNSEHSATTWMRQMIFAKLGWGQSFAETIRSPSGEPVASWPLAPGKTRAVRFEGVKIVETWKPGRGSAPPTPVALLPGEYVHLPDIGFDGLNGKSRIELASQGIALGLAQQEYLARFYGNNAAPDFFVSVPATLTKEKRDQLRAAFWEEHGGLERSHRQGFLWGGATAQPTGISPKDQDLVLGREFEDTDILGLYRVPPHKVARVKHGATFASVVEAEHAYVRDALMPDARLVQEVLWWEWLTDANRADGLFFEFNFRELLRGTPQQEAETLFKATGAPWMTRAEARQRQNLEPGDPAFDEPLQPVNMMTPAQEDSIDGAMGEPEEERAVPPPIETRQASSAAARYRIQRAHLPAFLRAAERFTTIETKTLERALRQAADLISLQAALEAFYAGFRQIIDRDMLPVLLGFAELIGAEIAAERGFVFAAGVSSELARDFGTAFGRRHIIRSRSQLAGIAADEAESSWEAISGALGARVGEWAEKRPSKIARSASVQAGGFFAMEHYARSGAQRKIWRQVGKSCPLCTTLDGKTAGIREAFGSAGDTIEPAPDHPDAADTAPIIVARDFRHAPAHSGCDCIIVGE